jgi:hypothetical protein
MKKTLLTLGLMGLVKLTTAQSLFYPQVTYTVGTNPSSVAAADFNNDGKADVATVNLLDNTMSVLFNLGTGTFTTQVTYTVGAHPFGIATADFNGDNKADIVTANSQDNTVSVLVNSGSGIFNAPVTYTVGTAPQGIVTADFNNDNKADIVVTNYSDNSISVLLNTGAGAFAAQVTYSVGTSPYAVAAGDFNGDNKTDVVVTNNNNNNVSVLINAGGGTFNPQTTYSVGSGPEGVAVGDFNNDGHNDIVAANFGGKVSVLINTGTGTFNAQVTYTVGTNPIGVATADFNGDGKMDIVATNNTSNNVSILVNNGSGFNAVTSYAVDLHPYNVATADFNGDGKTDIVTSNAAANDISILNSLIPAAALNFDGVDDNVSIPNNAAFGITNAITIESWIKTTGSPTTEQYVVTKNDDSYYIGLNVAGANGKVSFYLNGVSSSWLYSNSTTLNDNNWHHIGCTYNGSTMSIYVDGVLDNSTALTGTITTGISNMYLGSRNNNQFFQGSMDEFRIWNRSLCAAEIQHNMSGEIASNANGLVAYYKFNQGYGSANNTTITTLADSTSNAFNGTLNNFALTGATSNFVQPGAVTTGSMVTAFTNSLSAVTSQTNIACNGDASGTASVAVSGYTPYTYSWSSGGGTGSAQGSLLSGNYTCTINNGCGSIAKTFTLTEPSRLSVTATSGTIACNGGATTVTVSATGGTPTYSNTGTYSVTANSYTYTVTDANSCSATTTVTVSEPAVLSAGSILITDPTCYGGSNGAIDLIMMGGTPAYSYTWSPGATNGPSANNLSAGSYTCNVMDNNGCSTTVTITVNQPNAIATTQSPSICVGSHITVGTHTYTTAGTYTDVLTAHNGCDSTVTTNLTLNSVPSLTFVINNGFALCDWGSASSTPNYTLTATPSGGTFSGTAVSGNVFSPYQAGIGTFTLTYNYTNTATTCSNSTTATTTVSICEGIAQNNAATNNLQVYPNPFTNELTIVSTAKTNAILFDMLGNKINEFVLHNATQTISLESLAPGMYYLQVDAQKIKIIKQ